MRYTEARLTEVARLLLDGIDEDAVDFRPTYDGSEQEPVVLPARVPESAGQRLAGHRGRHGDVDPAAQRGRAVRRRLAPDRQSQCPQPHAAEIRAGSGFPDRRRYRGSARSPSRKPMRPGAARFACARAGARRRPAAAPMWWSITEIPWLVQKSRLVEKIAELLNESKLPLVADVRDELAEDIRLVIEPRVAHGRAGSADGVPVQAHRARKPHSAQHERAGEGAHPQGGRASPRRSRSGSSIAARCWCGARISASTRSTIGSRCSAAISSPISISTRSSRSSAARTSPSRS